MTIKDKLNNILKFLFNFNPLKKWIPAHWAKSYLKYTSTTEMRSGYTIN